MSKSSEIVGGGTLASTAAAPDALAVSAPVEEGGGGTTPEDTHFGFETLVEVFFFFFRGRVFFVCWSLWRLDCI